MHPRAADRPAPGGPHETSEVEQDQQENEHDADAAVLPDHDERRHRRPPRCRCIAPTVVFGFGKEKGFSATRWHF
jgi:hypothetical protein